MANISTARTPPASAVPDATPSRYEYRGLHHGDEIRLLKLHAGEGKILRGSLDHYRLSNPPPYRSLSYTWDQDDARFTLNMPGNTVLKVRKNLWDALKALRDSETDSLVWCDAVCINQEANEERNHQVKLMAQIYRSAKIGMVWLESTGEGPIETSNGRGMQQTLSRDHVAEFADATYRQSGDEMIQSLSRRYWTRKWIIQEIIHARTLVLLTAQDRYYMSNLEAMFTKVKRAADSGGDDQLQAGSQSLLGTPAAPLILLRAEAKDQQQQRLLYQLVKRFAANECKDPCDHIYALYSLVGDHRVNLTIDYNASSAERYRDVMAFIVDHEDIPQHLIPECAQLLRKLLQLNETDLAADPGVLSGLALTISVTSLRLEDEELQETAQWQRVRQEIRALKPLSVWNLSTADNGEGWRLHGKHRDVSDSVGRQEMPCLKLRGLQLVCLAGCRMERKDRVWHIAETNRVFILRKESGGNARIVGLAYILSSESLLDGGEHARSRMLPFQLLSKTKEFRLGLSKPLLWEQTDQTSSEVLTLSCSALLELMSLATEPPEPARMLRLDNSPSPPRLQQPPRILERSHHGRNPVTDPASETIRAAPIKPIPQPSERAANNSAPTYARPANRSAAQQYQTLHSPEYRARSPANPVVSTHHRNGGDSSECCDECCEGCGRCLGSSCEGVGCICSTTCHLVAEYPKICKQDPRWITDTRAGPNSIIALPAIFCGIPLIVGFGFACHACCGCCCG